MTQESCKIWRVKINLDEMTENTILGRMGRVLQIKKDLNHFGFEIDSKTKTSTEFTIKGSMEDLVLYHFFSNTKGISVTRM